MIYDYVIIGGGISGLYILDNLKKNFSNLKNGLLLERSSRLGGKIKTIYNNKNIVKYESGPWRFHNSHNKILKILESMELKYHKCSSTNVKSLKYTYDVCKNKKKTLKKNFKKNPGFSYLDNIIMNNNKCEADKINSFSKIPINMESSSKPYDVNLSYKGDFYVVDNGFSKIINNYHNLYEEFIQLNSMVIDININNDIYNILYTLRDKNDFEYKELKCKHLFLCVPPEYTLDWNIIKMNLLPLVYSVDTIPLHHIYGYSKNLKNFNNNSFYINTNSELAQIISGDFDNNWFQVSYSSGDNAEYWNRIKLQKPNLFKKLIRKSLKDNKIDIDFTKLESHYWDKAIHYWKPNYNFNINKCVKNSIYPHPINLPNCYWCGEAFSSIQGWIEGSLETSDLVLEAFNNNLHNYKLYKQITLKNNEEYLIIDNRYIDVKYWKKVHPGSTAAITNYLGEDVSNIFRQIKHTPYSWAMLYTLQKYWIFNNKIIEFI